MLDYSAGMEPSNVKVTPTAVNNALGMDTGGTSGAIVRQLEQRFRTLIESLPQHVFFKNRQSEFVSVNGAFARDVGSTPEELVGKSDFDLFPKELAEKYCADDRRIMDSRKSETIEEANVAGGKLRIVEVMKTPVIDDDGEVVGLLGIFTDITERKVAEENLKRFAAALERSNRELQDFAYVASHDLQEPLRKVMVFGDRLKSKFGAAIGTEGLDYLDRMQKAAARMQALINDLLTFSRVTTKPQPFVPVNLTQVVNEVISDLEARIEQVKGAVKVGELPTIHAEPMQMRQLFQNLIGNALKFHREGVPPEVRVSATQHKETPAKGFSREYVSISVADNGIGFDEKYNDRIFQVFQRLHGRTAYEGTGMGLAITRKIAEHHQGRVTAKSKPGEGSTFIITLPKTQDKHT